MSSHCQFATELWFVPFWQCRDAANATANANFQFKVFNYEVEGHDVRVTVLVNCRDELVMDKVTIKSLPGLRTFIGDKDWTKGAKRRSTQV